MSVHEEARAARGEVRSTRSSHGVLAIVAALLASSCGSGESAPEDGALVGDGIVIDGAPGNVVCVPGSIRSDSAPTAPSRDEVHVPI